MTHGTYTGYTRHGCRCMACTRANREYIRPRPINLPTVTGTNTLIVPERRVTGISGMTGSTVNNSSGVRVRCRCGASEYANKWIMGKSRRIESCVYCK